MSIRRIFALHALVIVLAFSASAQDAKQALNDQLWEAARKGDAAAVTSLLDKGADVNAKFRYGQTALFKAAERGNTEVVKVLLARGVDVTVKDTFYGSTAMSWALNNDHPEVVRAILEKSSESVDEVLTSAARSKKVPLLRVALEKGGAKPATMTAALAAVTMGEDKNPEIAELLKKAGATPPPQISAAILQSYVGKYKNEQGREYDVSVKEGTLFVLFTGGLFPMMAKDETTFQPVAFDGITLSFKVEGGKAVAFELKQGANTPLNKRVE